MKRVIIILTTISTLLLTSCATYKQTSEKDRLEKNQYDIFRRIDQRNKDQLFRW